MKDEGTPDSTERLKEAMDLVEKDKMECHWSPFCSEKGVAYVTEQIGSKPFEVWSCTRCNQTIDTEYER
jgi:ribosomal protein L37AE/L43A